MKSVDALRKWADGLCCIWIDPNDHSIIVTTCDDMPPSIDCVNLREHVNGILDNIEREVEDMVPLPVDADGEYIHVGDVMEWDNGTFTVHELKVTEDGWTTWDEQHGYTVHVDVCRHRATTVEDVLLEACKAYHGLMVEGMSDFAHDMPAPSEVIAEYAAKLTLRGDE